MLMSYPNLAPNNSSFAPTLPQPRFGSLRNYRFNDMIPIRNNNLSLCDVIRNLKWKAVPRLQIACFLWLSSRFILSFFFFIFRTLERFVSIFLDIAVLIRHCAHYNVSSTFMAFHTEFWGQSWGTCEQFPSGRWSDRVQISRFITGNVKFRGISR